MSTLPHEREKMFIDDLIDDCLKGRNKLIVVIAERASQVSFLVHQAKEAAENLPITDARQIRIYREALEFDNGASILFREVDSRGLLRGLRPDRIVIGGSMGEFWYLMLSSGAKIEAIA
jgi:hypothetical protein